MKFICVLLLLLASLGACFLSSASAAVLKTSDENEFNRDYIGVVYAPYIKNWSPGGSIPDWKNYTILDVSYMLNLVATKFKYVTTWSVGAGRVNESWTTGDAAGFVPVAAAQLNLKFNAEKQISLVQGVWHALTPELTNKEFENALAGTSVANSISPNTVTGVVLSSFTWMQYYRSWKDAVNVLQKYKDTVHHAGLKIGMRLDICGQIVSRTFPESGIDFLSPSIPSENAGQKTHTDIQVIAQSADFLICIYFPPANTVGTGTKATVKVMGAQILEMEGRFKEENPNLVVTWETGWPTAGVSRFGSKNTVRNSHSFWREMNLWAMEHKRLVYMYSAFDDPWRTNPNSSKELTDPEGPNGADSHFGWWTLKSNDDIQSIVEKEPEIEVDEYNGTSPVVVASAVLVPGVLLSVIGILIWRLYKSKKTIDRLTEKDISDFFNGVEAAEKGEDDDTICNALNLPYDRSMELDPSLFVIDELEILGKGQFGTVYKGKIEGIDGVVAFKKPNSGISASELKNLLTEIKIMIYIGQHQNIVKLYGAYTEEIRKGNVYIASECCSLGNLEGHLRGIPRTFTTFDFGVETKLENDELASATRYVNFTTKSNHYSNSPKHNPIISLIRWSYEIANGMEYLSNKKVVHADLAARNVLLTADGTAKISDFGLSRRLYEYTQYVKTSQEPLPWRWMAIETLKNLSFSSQSDVWAYGITLWEIFTLGDLPYPGLSWNVSFVDELERGLRLNKPKYATPEIFKEIVSCWHMDPDERPTFSDLRLFFESLYAGQKLEML